MENFCFGVLVGASLAACIILAVVNCYGIGQQKQCEQDHVGKKCELLWVPEITK